MLEYLKKIVGIPSNYENKDKYVLFVLPHSLTDISSNLHGPLSRSDANTSKETTDRCRIRDDDTDLPPILRRRASAPILPRPTRIIEEHPNISPAMR